MQKDNAAARLLLRRFNKHGYIEIVSEGYSMYPFIQPGDMCKFVSCDLANVRPGDVILYVAPNDRLVGHRLLRCAPNSLETELVVKGDTNVLPDPLVQATALLGRLTVIRRGHRVIDATNGLSLVWTWLILNTTFMSKFVRKGLHMKLWAHRVKRLCFLARE